MPDLAPFPDVELALVALLADLSEVGTETPADLQKRLPFQRVTCHGGGDDLITDLSRVDVDTFAATKAEAAEIAEATRQRLLSRPHLINGAVLDRCRTDTKPREIPWAGSPPPFRYTAAYAVSARR